MKTHRRQRGAVLIIFVIGLVLVATSVLFYQLNANALNSDHNNKTALALAEAKTALIGFVLKTEDISSPSYLPNPDLSLSPVIAEGRAAGASGAADISLLGKFPWRSLDLAPLSDGWNECLWYAVSGRYKNSPNTSFFNWDTQGQINVIDANGNLIARNLAALIIAPEFVLEKQDRSLSDPKNKQCGGNYDAKNYLDTYNNINAINNEVNYFVGSANNREAPDSLNKTFVLAKNNYYNDQFVFVTTDEVFSPLIARSDFTVQISALLDDAEFRAHLQSVVISAGKGTETVSCNSIITNSANKIFCDNWSEMLLLTELQPPQPIVIDGITTANCSRVLIFGGQKTTTQVRLDNADKATPSNYLEGVNLVAFATPIANNNNFFGVSSFNISNTSADILRCL